MKALILAGGRGRRLGSVSESINKCMLEVNKKPLIEYSLEAAAKLEEIREIIVVVGYRSQDIISRFSTAYRGKKIVYVVQQEQKGLVHAIACAAGALGKDDFMLMLGDEFMLNARHDEFVKAFRQDDVFALCGIIAVKDKELIKKTYGVILLDDGRVARLIEKPHSPPSGIMGTGNCIFNNNILSYIPKTPINQKRQEKELPDLIQCAVDDGHSVKTFPICREYVNVNAMEEFDVTRSYFAHL